MEKLKKIVTITLNPAIDTMYRMASFEINKGHRVEAPIRTAGGKGLNVSRVARCLNEDVLATGFVGGTNGEFIRNEIRKMGIEDGFVAIEGETRVCLAFNDDNGNQTELMEYGPTISESEQKKFLEDLPEILEAADTLVISGSLPRGVTPDLYKVILQKAAEKGVKALLDTSGTALKESLEAQPFMIKPNRDELEQWLGVPIKNDEQIWDAVRNAASRYGIPLVIVSDGANGCFVSYSGKLYKVSSVKVPVVNPVGSGDSFVAGIAVGLHRGHSIEETLALASACGAANASEAMTGFVNPDKVTEMMKQVDIQLIG
ncbi:MAG: 1-phosphofructokinase [Tuberibacillus sp.]